MANDKYVKRDSLIGIDRKRLRRTLRLAMGVSSNSAMFESRGQSWHTAPSEERQETVRRQMLEKHLREAKPSEHRFIETLSERLADAGTLPSVKVDKQQLAIEKRKEKPEHSCRSQRQIKHTVLAARVNRLANLHKELQADERVEAKTTDKYRAFDHFVMEID